MTAPAVTARQPMSFRLAGVVLAGAAVSVALGVYGRVHDPTGEQPYTLFFTATINLKVWFATAALALAALQLLLAARIYGKLGWPWPGDTPAWLGDAHRLVGTIAFLVSLPVAYHCLWALGFQSTDTRVLVHSLVGCVFYGVFTVKVLSVRADGLPGWLLPIAGGTTFAALVAVWLTSSLWFMTSRPAGVPLF
ncbi:MAG TPA: DUF6529 family protein [Acidimicrobiia bacterium]